MENELPIAIIGGGLAGLALARGFERVGVPYRIFEATERFSEIGAGISFLPNAIHAINLIDPNLFKSFESHITYDEDAEVSQLRIRCGEKQLGDYQFGDSIINLAKFGDDDKGRCGAHRARVLDELVQHIPPGVARFKKQMVDIVELDGKVEVHFEDGTHEDFKAAICCDGIKSRARGIVLGEDDPAVNPVYAKAYAYRALVSRADAERIIGPKLVQNGTFYVGKGRFLFHFPVEHGKLVNVIGVCVAPDSTWTARSLQEPCSKADMLRDFADFGEPLSALLATNENPMRWALFELPHVRTYCKGRICVIGDAAHGMTSHQGAGGSAAFEDAYVMAELLGDEALRADLPRAFRAFDRVRCERGNRIVSTSYEAGLIFTLQQEGIMDDMDKFKRIMAVRFDWLWGVDLVEQVKQAKEWAHQVRE